MLFRSRLTTHWFQSFKFRHPWLQLNLLTAFVAGAVVGIFEGTVERLVVLAAFLPVLAGQWFVWRFLAGPRWWSGHPFSL